LYKIIHLLNGALLASIAAYLAVVIISN